MIIFFAIFIVCATKYSDLYMKNTDQTVCLLAGRGNEATKAICRSLTSESITYIVKQKENSMSLPAETHKQWSGQPGQDLFFNGWKLLF